MNPELAWMVAIFWIGRKPRCEVSMASASQTVRTALEGLANPQGCRLCSARHACRATGRRLVASSDDSNLAIFDIAAERLIGAINRGEVRHVALAAHGKVALVEGGGAGGD